MDYRYLKAFFLTAKYLNFSKAANELHIAQSAVSRQVKLLEESLEEELFIRSSKKVILTRQGTELYHSIVKFDNRVSGIFQFSKNRPLNIGVLHGLLKNWLPPIVEEYRKYFNRSLSIQIGEGEALLKKLETSEFDLIFSNTEYQSETVTSRKLFKEEFIFISTTPINFEKTESYPWIIYSTEDRIFKTSKHKSKSITKVDSISTIISFVRMGLGIALVPKHCLADKKNLILTPIKKIESSTIYMTSLNYQKMPSYLNEFIQFIK